MRAIVVIPAYNEAASLPRVVRELHRGHPGLSVIIVDDGSSDGTAAVVAGLERDGQPAVSSLRLAVRLGLGGAVRAGLRYGQRLGCDTVIRIDGDGQHPVEQIDRLLEPIRSGRADAVQGSRYLEGGRPPATTLRGLSQRAVGRALSWLTGERVTDPTSGFWAFGTRAVRVLADHHPTGYPEPELRLFLWRNRLRVTEVPVRMRARLAGRTSLTWPRTSLALARVALAVVVVPLRPGVAGCSADAPALPGWKAS